MKENKNKKAVISVLVAKCVLFVLPEYRVSLKTWTFFEIGITL